MFKSNSIKQWCIFGITKLKQLTFASKYASSSHKECGMDPFELCQCPKNTFLTPGQKCGTTLIRPIEDKSKDSPLGTF